MRRSGPTGTVGPAQGYTFLYYVKQYFDLPLVNMRRPGLTDSQVGADISRPRLVGLDKVPCNLYGGDQPGAMRPATGRRFEETGYFHELEVHRSHGVQVLIEHRIGRAAPLGDVALQTSPGRVS